MSSIHGTKIKSNQIPGEGAQKVIDDTNSGMVYSLNLSALQYVVFSGNHQKILESVLSLKTRNRLSLFQALLLMFLGLKLNRIILDACNKSITVKGKLPAQVTEKLTWSWNQTCFWKFAALRVMFFFFFFFWSFYSVWLLIVLMERPPSFL